MNSTEHRASSVECQTTKPALTTVQSERRQEGHQVVREVVEVQVIDTTVEITLLVFQITGVGLFVVVPLEFKHGVSMLNVEGFVPPKSVHSHSAGDKSHCCQLQLGDREALTNSRNALDNEQPAWTTANTFVMASD